MKIAHSTIFRYAIPFATPLRLTGRELAMREGYVVLLFGDSGKAAYGEIAPLPGLHREHPEEAARQAEELLASLTGRPFPHTFSPLDGSFNLPPNLYPSVRTGMEMALLNLFAAESLAPLPELPGCNGHSSIPLNGLVTGTVGEIEEQAGRLVDEGYHTLKLKVGRIELRQEIAMVRFVRSIVGPNIAIRLDANRSWSLDTAVEFGRAVVGLGIEYIEEPLVEPVGLSEFVGRTGISVALDESLAEGNSIPAEIDPAVVQAFVIKPSVVGGIARTMELIYAARSHSISAVLSSAFETGISLGMYAWLASIANDGDVACGLDTYKFLEHDILAVPFRAMHGRVDAAQAWLHSNHLRTDILYNVRNLQ